MTRQKHILIICNPKAGQNKSALLERVLKKIIAAGTNIKVIQTEYAGHATEIAQAATSAGYDKICAAGGDGTIREVINGIYPAQIPLGLIPLGTANVLAKECLSDETANSIAEAILGQSTLDCWLGRSSSGYFSLMASVGPDAESLIQVNLGLKKYFGKTAYGLSFLKHLVHYKPVLYRLTIDGVPYSAYAAIIAKGRYYGGKYICTPDAKLTERLFHIALMIKPGRLAALSYALKMMFNIFPKDPNVKMVTGTSLNVTASRPATVQIDGDPGGGLPAHFSLSAHTIPLLVSPQKN